MSTFPILPTIDPFNRVEAPLSDGGRWWSPRVGSSFVPGSGNDYQQIHQFPYNGNDWSLKMQDWGNVLHPFPGPAFAIRLADPGAGYDQAIRLRSVGIEGVTHRLLRWDDFGNGYWCNTGNSGSGSYFNIYKVVNWTTRTLLGTTNVAASNAANRYIGAMAFGNEISMWWADVFSLGNPMNLALSVIDSSFRKGYIGFGSEGGVFGSMANEECGADTVPTRIRLGVQVNPKGAPLAHHV